MTERAAQRFIVITIFLLFYKTTPTAWFSVKFYNAPSRSGPPRDSLTCGEPSWQRAHKLPRIPTSPVDLLAKNTENSLSLDHLPAPTAHPRTVGWFGTTAVAMGGINQSLFLLGALFVGQGAILGQGSAAIPLLAVGLLLSWSATPGWTELVLMYPNRVGGIAATCAEAFRPYSPMLANLTGVCYWWGWVPTCGLTALLSASAINQWYLPWFPVPLLASCIVLFFTLISLCGVKWVMRLAMPIAVASAGLAFLSAVIPIFSGSVDWQASIQVSSHRAVQRLVRSGDQRHGRTLPDRICGAGV